MLLVEEEVPAVPEGRSETPQPRFEVEYVRQRARPRIHEIEAPAAQLARERLRVGLHPEDRGPPFARGFQRRSRRVDAGHDPAELRELGGRFARAAVQVEHALVRQVGERVTYRARQPALGRKW